MTIRSGGRPRDARQAHPAAQDSHDEPWQPEYRRPNGKSNGSNGGGYGRRGGGGSGVGGVIKFVLFAVILGAIVLVALVTVLRPLVRGAVIDWAADSPGALGMPFVADLVKEDLGKNLTDPASPDTEQVPFVIGSGESATTIAARLEDEGFLTDRRAFVLVAVERDLTAQLKTGEFILRRSMTPDELVTALLDPPAVAHVDIDLRTGLRLEQVTAKLQTIEGLTMDPADFYELATHPTPELLADFPWLDLPDGASLEGYLWPANYRVLPDTTGEELVRLMLERFHGSIEGRMDVPAERGMTFHQILTLASLVDREAILDEEKPVIAGVYQNRIDKIPAVPHGLLQADPTVLWANDTVLLDGYGDWTTFLFWDPKKIEGGYADLELPADLAPYNTYAVAGLPPGPICTPTLASIDAALAPDVAEKYAFFVAIPPPDGQGRHDFSKTIREHQRKLVEYGYN